MTVSHTFKYVTALAGLTLAVTWLAASPVLATHQNGAPHDDEKHETMTHDHGGDAAGADLNEVTKAYDDAMKKMHEAMSIKYSGDVNVDFVRGMVPHHQGAIDQAQILLKHSKDERLKYLAKGIIAAQTREIRFMTRWLKEHDQGVQSAEIPAWLKNTPSATDDTPAPAETAPATP